MHDHTPQKEEKHLALKNGARFIEDQLYVKHCPSVKIQ